MARAFSLIDLLRITKNAKSEERQVWLGEIRRLLEWQPVDETIKAIDIIDDIEMIKLLLAAGPRGRAYTAARAKLYALTAPHI